MEKYSTFIGIDLGDKHSHYAILDEDRRIRAEAGAVETTEGGFVARFQSMRPSTIAIEAGTYSPWVSRLLTGFGHRVLVANPRRLRAIYENARKNDKVDAMMLARLARSDDELLHPIQHRGEQAHAHLSVVRARNGVVKARTMLINQVRGLCKSFGHRIDKYDAGYFPLHAREEIPPPLKPAVFPLLKAIENLTKTINAYDKQLHLLCKHYKETQLLQQIAGVGEVTALTFALTIDDPHRFSSSRDAGAYFGLIPGSNQSGDQDPQMPITKTGNEDMRRLLVGSAQYLLGPLNKQDSELRQWGLNLAGPVNNKGKHDKIRKRRAVVAVARKLAVLMHLLWVTGSVYDPFFHQTQREAQKTPPPVPQRGSDSLDYRAGGGKKKAKGAPQRSAPQPV
jgi:transposase